MQHSGLTVAVHPADDASPHPRRPGFDLLPEIVSNGLRLPEPRAGPAVYCGPGERSDHTLPAMVGEPDASLAAVKGKALSMRLVQQARPPSA